MEKPERSKLLGADGQKLGSEDSPIPITAFTLEQLQMDTNRMLARILAAHDLLDAEDLQGYLE